MSYENQTKRAILTKPSSDKHTYHIVQVSYMDKACDVEIVTPYGLYSTAPINSLVTLWNVSGQEENRVGIANSPKDRFRNLAPGEVMIGIPTKKSSVKFSADGSITVTGQNQMSLTIDSVGNVTLNTQGKLNISAQSDITVASQSKIQLNAPANTIKANGNVLG